jgi:nitrile hydratase
VDETRAVIERIPAAEYLNSSYYERWFRGLEMLMIEHGHITAEELEAKIRSLQQAA